MQMMLDACVIDISFNLYYLCNACNEQKIYSLTSCARLLKFERALHEVYL